MSLRIGQKLEPRDYDVFDVVLKRGTTAVTTTGQLAVGYFGGAALIAGRFVLTVAPPGSGNWTVVVSLPYPDQLFGVWNTATTSTPAGYSAGVITPNAQPTLNNGNYFTLQGMMAA